MIEKSIYLKNGQDVEKLVEIVSRYPYDMDLSVGKFMVDAKSILGVLEIGVGRDLKLCINADNADELILEIDTLIIKSPDKDRK